MGGQGDWVGWWIEWWAGNQQLATAVVVNMSAASDVCPDKLRRLFGRLRMRHNILTSGKLASDACATFQTLTRCKRRKMAFN